MIPPIFINYISENLPKNFRKFKKNLRTNQLLKACEKCNIKTKNIAKVTKKITDLMRDGAMRVKDSELYLTYVY